MITMDQIHRIRDLLFRQGKNLAEIATILGVDWRTVRKYVDKEDFNEPIPVAQGNKPRVSKLDPYKPLIDKWLSGDSNKKRKQQHTATRIFNRLQEEVEGFDCGKRTVTRYVAEKKKLLKQDTPNGFLPLLHKPGEAQADFGTADFYEGETLYRDAKYLVLSFPHSNGAYLQLNYGENLECLLEGLVAMFEHMGGVPREIWFDNTKTIVSKLIHGGGRKITERFQRFCEHYRFEPKFMNPASGWEKGNVENKVGYLRRNLLVPVPHFNTLAEGNKQLLEQCDLDMNRPHYDDAKGRTIKEIIAEDKAVLIPLPAVPFDTARYISVVTDKYGKFTLENGKYKYSVSPDYCATTINLKITSNMVYVMDQDMHDILCHRRLYGANGESMDWVPYLKYIAQKPRSLRNSGIYEMMPLSMQEYMDRCETSERGNTLKVLAKLTEQSGFESALRTVDEAIRLNVNDPDSLQNLYRRVYSDIPLLAPLESLNYSVAHKSIPFRNEVPDLNALMKKGSVDNG